MNKDIKIALIAQEKISAQMAGSAIRYFELAKVLSTYFSVTLFSNGKPDLDDSRFRFNIKFYIKSARKSKSSIKNFNNYDYVIAQELSPDLIFKVKQNNIKLISDLYDPLPIEIIEHTKNDSFFKRLTARNFINNSFLMQMVSADHILCSNKRQKSLYENMAKKHNIDIAEKRITLLPFGLSETKPVFTDENMIYNLFPSIKKDDKIVLWGGGIWNWFDALSVVKAINQINEKRKDIKLVFMGAKNKHFDRLQDKNLQTLLKYCKKNQLENKCVFFNYSWVPYDKRANFLLAADICISTHFDCEETYYSFRTRILDYLWAQKPIICTEGDVFSDLISKYKLGKVVRYKNVDDIEKAILELIDKPDLYKIFENNIKNFKDTYAWTNITKELVTLIQNDSIKSQKKNWIIFNIWKFKFFFWVGLNKITRTLCHE